MGRGVGGTGHVKGRESGQNKQSCINERDRESSEPEGASALTRVPGVAFREVCLPCCLMPRLHLYPCARARML